MRSIKRIAALVLSIVMICSFTMPAFAEGTVVPTPPPTSNTEQGDNVATPPETETVPEEEAPAQPNAGEGDPTPPTTEEEKEEDDQELPMVESSLRSTPTHSFPSL